MLAAGHAGDVDVRTPDEAGLDERHHAVIVVEVLVAARDVVILDEDGLEAQAVEAQDLVDGLQDVALPPRRVPAGVDVVPRIGRVAVADTVVDANGEQACFLL